MTGLAANGGPSNDGGGRDKAAWYYDSEWMEITWILLIVLKWLSPSSSPDQAEPKHEYIHFNLYILYKRNWK